MWYGHHLEVCACHEWKTRSSTREDTFHFYNTRLLPTVPISIHFSISFQIKHASTDIRWFSIHPTAFRDIKTTYNHNRNAEDKLQNRYDNHILHSYWPTMNHINSRKNNDEKRFSIILTWRPTFFQSFKRLFHEQKTPTKHYLHTLEKLKPICKINTSHKTNKTYYLLKIRSNTASRLTNTMPNHAPSTLTNTHPTIKNFKINEIYFISSEKQRWDQK
jgi:hypothetical protein